MLSDPLMICCNPGRGWICRPLGTLVKETANFLAVQILQRFTAYTVGFRGGASAARGRGKLGAKVGSDPQRTKESVERERREAVWIVLLFGCT